MTSKRSYVLLADYRCTGIDYVGYKNGSGSDQTNYSTTAVTITTQIMFLLCLSSAFALPYTYCVKLVEEVVHKQWVYIVHAPNTPGLSRVDMAHWCALLGCLSRLEFGIGCLELHWLTWDVSF